MSILLIRFRLFLQNAANKYKETQNLQKMAHRMDAICMHLKANMNNTDVSLRFYQR